MNLRLSFGPNYGAKPMAPFILLGQRLQNEHSTNGVRTWSLPKLTIQYYLSLKRLKRFSMGTAHRKPRICWCLYSFHPSCQPIWSARTKTFGSHFRSGRSNIKRKVLKSGKLTSFHSLLDQKHFEWIKRLIQNSSPLLPATGARMWK